MWDLCPHLGEIVRGRGQRDEQTQELVRGLEGVGTAKTGLWTVQAFLVGSRNDQ